MLLGNHQQVNDNLFSSEFQASPSAAACFAGFWLLSVIRYLYDCYSLTFHNKFGLLLILSPGHCTENHSLFSLTDVDLPPEHKDPSLPSAKTDLEDRFGLMPYVGRDPCLLTLNPSSLLSLLSLLAKRPPRELRLVFLCLNLPTQSTLPLVELLQLPHLSPQKNPMEPRLLFLSLFFPPSSSSMLRLIFLSPIIEERLKFLSLLRLGEPKLLFRNLSPSLSMVFLLSLGNRSLGLPLLPSPLNSLSPTMIIEFRLVFLFRPNLPLCFLSSWTRLSLLINSPALSLAPKVALLSLKPGPWPEDALGKWQPSISHCPGSTGAQSPIGRVGSINRRWTRLSSECTPGLAAVEGKTGLQPCNDHDVIALNGAEQKKGLNYWSTHLLLLKTLLFPPLCNMICAAWSMCKALFLSAAICVTHYFVRLSIIWIALFISIWCIGHPKERLGGKTALQSEGAFSKEWKIGRLQCRNDLCCNMVCF